MSSLPTDSDHQPASGDAKAAPSRRTVLMAGAAGAVVVPALSACGSGSGGGSGAGGGRLRVGVAGGSSNDTVDAHNPTDNPDIARVYNLYAGLCRFAADFSIEMALAESLEPNDKADVWTATLKEGLTFHDGSPVDADALIFTLKRITDPDKPGTSAQQLATMKRDELKKVDDRTVEIPFEEGYVTFKELCSEYAMGLVPEGYDPENPVGAGPFAFSEFTKGERSLFTSFDDFWDGRPKIDEVEIINFADESARVNALVSGEVDAIAQVPHSQIEVIESNESLQIMESESGMWLPFTMRVDSEPFDDEKVRQAFRLIVDRQGMIDQALNGHGLIGNDVYGRFDPFYDEELPQREQDIKQARKLLKEAGYEDDLEVELVTGPINAGAEAAAQVFKEQAKQAGVTVKLKRVTSEEFYGDNYLKWTFAQDFWSARHYLSQTAQGSYPGAPFNETHWEDEEWIEVVDKARAETDDAEREKLVQQAMKIEYERGGYIIWGFPSMIDGVSKKVKGFEPSVVGHPLGGYNFRSVTIEA
ncbi:ABC transporter substrate-binding protein [Nocardiopsis suaedae]|uniref:ABC transporter substrate-binding protein n=1 Tax=Nocardiopsis suaedae TaxID=3018444 RepID=A0ABT4TNS1_9ACTN|nr:ABC transporter substrate-binding protein [Nocardiopsis suaedae]MDA2806343.1 ABC transporter substrate-binding protein [Nocardiopsis suaedae]